MIPTVRADKLCARYKSGTYEEHYRDLLMIFQSFEILVSSALQSRLFDHFWRQPL